MDSIEAYVANKIVHSISGTFNYTDVSIEMLPGTFNLIQFYIRDYDDNQI